MEMSPKKSYEEYLLLINPDQETVEEIIAERDYFMGRCQSSYQVSPKPHITLLNAVTLADSKQSKQLVRMIDEVSKRMKQFEVWLNGYSTFKGTNDLCINVMNKMKLRSFVDDFKKRLHQEPLNSVGNVKLIDDTHITLASKIDGAELERLTKEYIYRPFEKEFWVKSLVLLKRRVNISSSRITHFSKFKEFKLG